LLNWSARAAAILVLLLGVYTLFQIGDNSKTGKKTVEVASVKDPADSPQGALEGREQGAGSRELGAGTREQGENQKEIEQSPEQTAQKMVTDHKMVASAAKPSVRSQSSADRTEDKASQNAAEQVREPLTVEKIQPLMARLEEEPEQLALAVSHAVNTEKINDPRNVVTLEEYLASRARKATNDGLLSVNRLLRVGLSVASELSGERIGYTVKNGKVASVDFESKLLAFELPLEKK
jgi:hypothetical protein